MADKRKADGSAKAIEKRGKARVERRVAKELKDQRIYPDKPKDGKGKARSS